ncbi:hypothetical protein C9975_04585 [Thalassospira xiamenensis]|nr:hypothetical protein C9975_04585 [Thalassospira xiamenensis]
MRFLSSVGLLLIASFAVYGQDENEFYTDKERGWFWFEEFPVEEEKKPETPPEAIPSQPESEQDATVRIDVEWLRENLPVLREAAINNPTRANIANHMYAQRYMLDISSRFSTKTMEFMEFEGALDESKRRPYAAFSLAAFADAQRDSIKRVISKINESSHIWFFYSSTCPYCKSQIPVLRELQIRFGIDVLAISMDGGRLPGVEDFTNVVDKTGVAQRFGVKVTPTIFLALDGDRGFTNIGEGLTALPTLQDRIILSARMENIISQDEYQSTQDVREINVLTDEDGTMMADKNLLQEDPGYLAEILKQKLIDSKHQSTTPVNYKETQQ